MNVVLLQLSDFSLTIASLISQLLKLCCGHLALSVLFFDGDLQPALLVGQFVHLRHCSIFLTHEIIELLLDLCLTPFIFPQLFLNFKDVLLQAFQCTLNSAFFRVNCSQTLVIFRKLCFDLGK
jgi:hypothetical protein